MDFRKIKKLIELVQESGIAEIEITEGEGSVRISAQQSQIAQTPLAYSVPSRVPPFAPVASASGSHLLVRALLRAICRINLNIKKKTFLSRQWLAYFIVRPAQPLNLL